MGTTVRSRPNHYEVLGLAPTAGNDEISRAFAQASAAFRPHTFGTVTELCVAYETLRDPVKRRAYDQSLGITPKQLPPVSQVSIRLRPEPVAAFPRQAFDRGAGATTPMPDPTPEPRPRPEADATPRTEPQFASRALHFEPEERIDLEAIPIDWKRTGTVIGGVVVAACLLGGLAGWWSSSDVAEAGTPDNSVSVPLPPTKARSTALDPAPLPAPAQMTMATPDRPRQAAMVVPPKPAARQVQQIEPEESLPRQDEQALSASTETTADTQLASNAAASLPLPNKVIARTIDRIGYACGAVASASPVEGEGPGVYKVTCTSGQSYQASPVNGRYRFRRWSM